MVQAKQRLGLLKKRIERAAETVSLEPDVLKALVLTENAEVDPLATRFEPGFYERYIEGDVTWSRHDLAPFPQVIASSYGLCQVMLTTAFWAAEKWPWIDHEFSWSEERWWELFRPDLNLAIGAQVLRHKIDRYGETDGVAAYNGGAPHKEAGRLRRDLRRYVERFERNLARVS